MMKCMEALLWSNKINLSSLILFIRWIHLIHCNLPSSCNMLIATALT